MVGFLLQIVRLVVPVVIGWVLCRAIGWIPAFGICAVCAVLFPAVGSSLLLGCNEGELTWKNYLAGWLVPWGYQIGNGKLWRIAIVSGVVWICLFGAGIFLAQQGNSTVEAHQIAVARQPWNWPVLINCLLVAFWLIDAAALFYLAGHLSGHASFQQPPGSTIARIMAIAAALIVISVVFRLAGKPVAALLIAGVPPLVIGVAAGAWCGLIIIVGRNTRWN